jgi:hypothetical protein
MAKRGVMTQGASGVGRLASGISALAASQRRARSVAGALAACCLAAVMTLGGGLPATTRPAAVDDPWAPGYRCPEWDKIELVQRYPQFPGPEPDWGALAKDDSPLVRAVTMLGLGRTADVRRVALVIAGLDDPSPDVRRAALWALCRMETPAIREPLLKVIGTWPRLETTWPGYIDVRWFGLPRTLNDMPLADRQTWLTRFDAKSWPWTYTGPSSQLSPAGGSCDATLTVSSSYWDGQAPFSAGLCIQRGGGGTPSEVHPLDGVGYWFQADHWRGPGREFDGGRMVFPHCLADGQGENRIKVGPSERIERTYVIASKIAPLPPGIYHFAAFHSTHPVYIRVTRRKQIEEQIPEWLAHADDPAVVKHLGEYRVRAAVPTLVKRFRERGMTDGQEGLVKNRENAGLAEALGQIGDPAAVPALLEFPLFTDDHWMTRNVEPYLRAIGPAAYPEYEKRVRNWQAELEAGRRSALHISLSILGHAASAEAQRAACDLLKAVPRGPEYRELRIVAVRVVAESHPAEAVAAIWEGRHDRLLMERLLAAVQEAPPAALERIVRSLVGRLDEADDILPAAKRALLQFAAKRFPDIEQVLNEERLRFTDRQGAAEAIQAAKAGRSDKQTLAHYLAQFAPLDRDIGLALNLAMLYYDLGDVAQSEGILKWVTPLLKSDSDRVLAEYHLAEIHRRRGEMEAAWRLVDGLLRRAQQGQHYETFSATLSRPDLVRLSSYLELQVRVPGLRLEQAFGGESSVLRYVEVAEDAAFHLADDGALVRFRPLSGERSIIGRLTEEMREYMPLDGKRVFVALSDGSAVLVEAGRGEPAWRRPISMGYDSYLTASPRAITVADERGVLRCLSPKDGETLWERSVAGRPWQECWRSRRGFTRQCGDALLLPENAGDAPRRFVWLDLGTGAVQRTVVSPWPVEALAATPEYLVFASRQGQVCAVSLKDGSRIWEKDLRRSSSTPHLELDAAGTVDAKDVLVGVCDSLWALDAATGRVRWTRTWAPRPTAGLPRRERQTIHPILRPTPTGLWYLVCWDVEGESETERVDVARLTLEEGKVVFQETAPFRWGAAWASNAFVSGETLVFRRRGTWETWRLDGKPAE